MGNTISPNNLTQNITPSDYQLVGKFSSIRWGELFEMRNIKTGQYAFMQEKYAIDLETHQKNVQDCAYRMSLTHKNLAVIYGFIHNDTVDAFTNTYKLCIFLEHIPSNLNEVIRARKTHSSSPQHQHHQRSTVTPKYFDEIELLAFMNQLIDVMGFLQNNGINQGDIAPDVCLISSNGTVKLLDRKLIYNDIPSFTLASQGNSNVLLTPLELEALNNNEAQPFENRYKADVFRLGMTLLECATFKKSSQIYDWNNYVIDLETLATRLAEVRERYSQDFYGPLREMLRFEEHKRPDFVQLRQNIHEETATKVANTTSVNTPRGEENPLKRSISSMGPKLVANASPRPDTNLQSHISHSHSRKSSHDISANFKVAFKEALERGKMRASHKKEKNEEDLEDEMVELEDNMKINHVPYTEEARISVGSSQITMEDQYLKRNSVKTGPSHYEDMKMNTRLLKTMSVSNNQSRENFSLKDFPNRSSITRGTGQTSPTRKKGNIFGSQKLDLESKSMILRNHQKAIFPETAPHSQWEGINFQNAINFSQMNKHTDHRKESTPKSQALKSQQSVLSSHYDRISTIPVISEEPSSSQLNKLKFNENAQSHYFPGYEDSPVSLHSQSQYITTQPNTVQTGDAFDILQVDEPKQHGSRHNFKLPFGEDRNYANPVRQRGAAAPDQRVGRTGKDISSMTDEQRSQKSRETSRGKGSQERTSKSKIFEDNRSGFSIVSYADKPAQNKPDRSVERKQNSTLESLKYPISNFYKTSTTTNSSLNSRARSPQMFVHEKRKSFTGDSQGTRLNQTAVAQGGYQETHIRPYMTYKREENKIEGYNNVLSKSIIREEDESLKDSFMVTRKSFSAKKAEFQPEANINDRFEQAMERSRKSKAIVRDMSANMRSSSRSTDPMKRSMAENGVSSGFVGTRINQ